MAKYRVVMMEKIFYEVYVEADSEDEAEKKANELFGEDGAVVSDSYAEVIDIEEETE